MKILHLTKKYPNAIGGDSTIVSGIEKQQIGLGHTVYVLTSNCESIIKKEKVIKFGLKEKESNLDNVSFSRMISLFFLFFYSFYLIRKLKPDIIHSHSPDMGFAFSFVSKFYKIPMVHTCHGISFPYKQFNILKRKAEVFFLKHSGFSKIFVIDLPSLRALRKINIKNSTYVPNGVDTDMSKYGTIKKSDPKKFLFVGRLENQKGLIHLIRACKKLSESEKEFTLTIIGDGSERVNLEKEAKKLELSKYIKFKGKMSAKQTISYYKRCDIFVLPSLWEGLPTTVLEAWACGLPVIVSDLDSLKDLCVDKDNCLTVPVKNEAKLSEAMLELLEDDKLFKHLRTEGKKLVDSTFSWFKIINLLENAYKGAIYA